MEFQVYRDWRDEDDRDEEGIREPLPGAVRLNERDGAREYTWVVEIPDVATLLAIGVTFMVYPGNAHHARPLLVIDPDPFG